MVPARARFFNRERYCREPHMLVHYCAASERPRSSHAGVCWCHVHHKAQAQEARKASITLTLNDGHGAVECTTVDPYGLIAENSNKEVGIPRSFLPAVGSWAEITPCHVMAWCDRMAWKDGDHSGAYVLWTVKTGKSFAMRPAALAPLLPQERTAALDYSSDQDTLDVLEVTPLVADAQEEEAAAEDAGAGCEDDDGAFAGADASRPAAEYAKAVQERISRLHGTTVPASFKNPVFLEGMGKSSKRYKPGCKPTGWDKSAGDFMKAYTDTVPGHVRDKDEEPL